MKNNKIPKDWQEVELGEVADFLRGPFGSSVQKSVCVKRGKNTYKLYEQGNIIRNDFFRGEYYLSPQKFKELEKFELKPGDIATTCAGTLGKIAVAPEGIEKGVINSVLMRIRIKEDKIIPDFFLYLFRGSLIQNYIGSQSQGVAVKNLFATKILKKIKILLPPLIIQKKIVSILEKAEKLKQKREEADKKTNEYLKSIFYEMFFNKGFEEVEILDVCEINPKKSELEKIDKNLEVSFVPMAIVQEHEISFIPKENKKLNEVYTGYTYFKNGDVLLAKVTPCFENGKSGIARDLKNGIGFGSSEYHVIRPSNRLLAELIYFFISDNSFLISGKKQMSGTGGLKRLPKEYIAHQKIPLPPISLQQKFAKIVEKVEKLREKQKESKERINEMFNVLMQKAFRGEL